MARDCVLKFIFLYYLSLIFLCTANHSDGQYQASPFKDALAEITGTNNSSISTPVIWDGGHWADLCVKHVREKSGSADFFSKFLERGNSFHVMFGRGKGFEEYMAVKDHTSSYGASPSAYCTTR